MSEDLRQIAADLQRLEKEMAALAEDVSDAEYVRTRLGDFSSVLTTLRERLLCQGQQQQPQEQNED